MKKSSCLFSAAIGALTLLAASAQEAAPIPAPPKTWEVHARMDGGGNPKLAEFSRQLLAPLAHLLQPGAPVSFTAAGLDNPATPGDDWIAEVRGLSGTQALLNDASKYGNIRLAGQTLVLTLEDETYAIWSPEEGVIRAAYPVTNQGAGLPASTGRAGGTWASGRIQLGPAIKRELPESSLLRSIDEVGFEITANGALISGEVLTESISPELAAEASAQLRKIAAAAVLMSDGRISMESLARNLTIKMEGDRIRVSFTIPEEVLQRRIADIQRMIQDASGKQ